MKIIQSGYNYKVYDDGLTVHGALPAFAYTVSFSPQSGWSLNRYADIEIKEKVYGIHQNSAPFKHLIAILVLSLAAIRA